MRDPDSAGCVASHVFRRVQLFHRFVEIAGDRQRQHVDGVVDRAQHRRLVVLARPAQHPGGDPVLVAGMADADAQPVELAVAQVLHGVAQAVLAAVAAVELEPRRARRQVELVVRQQHSSGSIFQ